MSAARPDRPDIRAALESAGVHVQPYAETKRPSEVAASAEPSSPVIQEGPPMNGRPDITAAAAPASLAEWAALEFETWDAATSEWHPPSNEEWAKLANPHLESIRIGFAILHQTKEELIPAAREDDGQTLVESLEHLQATIEWLRGLSAIVEGAKLRLLVASAAAALDQPEAS